MPLRYPVAPRTILICDYDKGGFRPPEMVKRRPAIVLVGKLPRRNNLHTVIPLSGTPSDERNEYHCKVILNVPLPQPFEQTIWWAKADMVATVGMDRLDLFRTRPDQYGSRKYLTDIKIDEVQFDLVKRTVARALGLDSLTNQRDSYI